MTSNGLRTQYPYGQDALSPRPLYDFPSPTSNYPSGVGGASPGFYPMAYNISPRFGGSAFIPPADVFVEGRNGSGQGNGAYVPRGLPKRGSEALNSDPVAMHLLVETAITDSQNFDVLSVEEVEALKQEQKGLDARLGTVRRRLEAETKIRDAARSLTRLTSKKGHQRGLGSKGSIAFRDMVARSEDDLNVSNKKVDDLTRELLEIESRMRLIDMQLLMHTAGVLQLTHNGPRKRKTAQLSNGADRRPDSPASIYTYENDRSDRMKGEDGFDERSFYRSPENLDSLMHALQNGTHHHSPSVDRQNQAITSMSKRLEELNERLRELIVQANPERNLDYSLPPQSSPDPFSVDRQLDFLDQGLRDISAEQANMGNKSTDSLNEIEGRLEGINNQLYAMLSRSDAAGGDKVLPPPPVTGDGSLEQLNYMEDSFYNIGQLQYSLMEQIDELRSQGTGGQDVEKYETTLIGLWQIIQAGEEEARERKRERRRLIAEDPDNNDELSPDEDYNANEEFSLPAFSAKVQWLFSRATSLKDKQSILLRQIKQQRELNSKSDAQKEAEVNRLNEQVLSARSAQKTMEAELERAMAQLGQFDEQKAGADSQALRTIQERNTGLESQLRDLQEQSIAYENQVRDAESRAASYQAQIRDAQERAITLEAQLRDAQDDARVEAATIQAELAQSAAKIDEATQALRAATAAKQEAELRASEAANALNAKEEELRNLEGEVVRLTTELTFAKAELDGAYGTRAERAAESGATTKKELEELAAKNLSLEAELSALQKASEAASQSEAQARNSERNLKSELSAMAAEYEALTRDAIQNEKDRDALEASIDKLRDEKESLEMELSDERVKWLGIRSPSVAAGATGAAAPGGGVDMGATSIRMLREDFRKMMRDRTAEGLRALRVSVSLLV